MDPYLKVKFKGKVRENVGGESYKLWVGAFLIAGERVEQDVRVTMGLCRLSRVV